MLVFAYVPFDLVAPLLITYIKSTILVLPPMKVWRIGYGLRMFASLMVISLVYNFNQAEDLTMKFLTVNVITVIIYSFTSNIMFTSQCAFFAKIADSSIGGTYLTLLNTLSNLGGTLPKYFVLRSIDFFTILDKENDVVDCTDESHLTRQDYFYDANDEKCYKIVRDGYYVTCGICFLVGIVWIVAMMSTIDHLDSVSIKKWKVPRKKNSKNK